MNLKKVIFFGEKLQNNKKISMLIFILFFGIVSNISKIYCCTNENEVKGLFSKELKVRRNSYENIIKIGDNSKKKIIINELINILKDKKIDKTFEGTLHLTIKALGKLKAVEAIPYMLDYFTFVPDGYRVEEMIPTQWYYPTALALIDIGRSSIRYMKKIIKNPKKTDKEKKLAAWVINEILGKDKAIELLIDIERKCKYAKLSNGKKLSIYIKNFKVTFYNPKQKL